MSIFIMFVYVTNVEFINSSKIYNLFNNIQGGTKHSGQKISQVFGR